MAPQKARQFPKQIFVAWEKPLNDDPYLTIDESPNQETVADGEPVAVYELRGVKTKRVAHSLE